MDEHKHVLEKVSETDTAYHFKCQCGLEFDEPKQPQPIMRGVPYLGYQQPQMQPRKFGKPFEALYECHNCGRRFKKKYPFGVESPDSEICSICGVNKSMKITWK